MSKPEELDYAAQSAELELDRILQDFDGSVADYIHNNYHWDVIKEEIQCKLSDKQ